MADKKITDLTAKTTPVGADIVPIVDPADLTMGSTGSTRRTTINGIVTAVLALGGFGTAAFVASSTFDPAGSATTVQTNLTSHTSNVGNPHSTTAAQVGSYTTSQADTLLAAKAADNAVAHVSGTETIAGVKTFSSPPVASGASLTSLNGSAVSSGTVPQARLPIVGGARARQLVATRANALGGGRFQDTSGNGRTYLSRHYVPNGAASLTMRFANYYSGTYYETPIGNDILVQATAWTDSSGTTRLPVTFGGQRTAQLAGTLIVGSEIESDPVGLYVAPGSYLYVETYVQPYSLSRTLSFTATGGTFTLTYGGVTTASQTYSGTYAASALQSALQGLAVTGASSITVSGSNGGPFTITLPSPTGGAAIPIFTVTAAGLTGGTATLGPASTVYFPFGLQLYGSTGSTSEGNTVGSNAVDSGSVTLSNTAAYTPTAIRGYVVSGPKPTAAALGDSIVAGTGDANPDLGFLHRGFGVTQYGTGGSVAYLSLARASEKMTDQVGLRGYLRTTRSAFATDVFCETGTNDVYTDLVTLSTLQSRGLALWAQHGQGGARIWHTTLVPRTSSTDFYATVANQTTLSQETVRSGWNSWLYDGAPIQSGSPVAVGTTGGSVSRCAVYDYTGTIVTAAAGPSGHPLSGGVIDTATTVEVNSSGTRTRNGGYWTTTGYAIADSGTSSGSNSTTTLVDSSKSWTTNQHYGKRIVITSGTGATEYGTVQSNTTTTLTIGGSWSVTPDATSAYRIDNAPSAWDGTHPSMAGHILMAVPIATVVGGLGF